MRVDVDYGPDTPEEMMLKRQMMEIQRRHRIELQPYIDRLCAIHATKLPKYFITPDESDMLAARGEG